MKNDAKELVRTFVADKLDDNITRLASFELGALKNNKVYGCPGRNFDSDDTNLMRAIYCVAFSDTWKGLSMQSLENGVYRGDTINSYHGINLINSSRDGILTRHLSKSEMLSTKLVIHWVI